MSDEERVSYLRWVIKTWNTYREDLWDKILRVEAVCTITDWDDFPEIVWKDILCKQFFLFPERYIEFFVWNPIFIIVPYYRVQNYINENKEYLNVYDMEIDVKTMMDS